MTFSGRTAFATAVQTSHPIAFFFGHRAHVRPHDGEFWLLRLDCTKSPSDIIGHWSAKLFGAGSGDQGVCLLLGGLMERATRERLSLDGSQFLPFAAAATWWWSQTFGEEFILRLCHSKTCSWPWETAVGSVARERALVQRSVPLHQRRGPECVRRRDLRRRGRRIAIRTGGSPSHLLDFT